MGIYHFCKDFLQFYHLLIEIFEKYLSTKYDFSIIVAKYMYNQNQLNATSFLVSFFFFHSNSSYAASPPENLATSTTQPYQPLS